MSRKVDDQSVHLFRRQRFLDHLIARFAERFHDYATIMSEVLHASPETLVAQKCAFLQEYDKLSLDRSLAYNYRPKQATDLWDTENVSGLEKRLAKLLGLSNANRRNLSDAPGKQAEGMYLIENILLRPEDPSDPLLPIPDDPDSLDCAPGPIQLPAAPHPAGLRRPFSKYRVSAFCRSDDSCRSSGAYSAKNLLDQQRRHGNV